ncbi:antibiotic biosynthesis monooxygenase family protein [Streptomyces sp. NBC_01465]|uniref:antibiotic biosynthesis monooxygenase family protein n=1 Tax=Streptomyces sp. NBC_01465 TaxID=2903878 RepID=UPI002E334C1B|nr:antibiotic biosynthesis monooxygenase [Streptomyces sp. NBC_01465]
MTNTPVAAFEPPYYAAIFTSVRTDGDNGYGETVDRMHALVQDMPGFLGYESARVPGGVGITVAYFRDAESIRGWKQHAEHSAAKEQGRAQWYERYTLHIAKVEHSHEWVRG